MADILTLRSAIDTKLKTLTGSNQPLAVVFDYHTLKNDGQWPYVSCEPSSLTSEYLDTVNNFRSYTFDIFIYQEITTKWRDLALWILLNAFNDIINIFDKDFTLWWVVDWGINAVEWDFGQLISADWKILFANIKLICKISKDITL